MSMVSVYAESLIALSPMLSAYLIILSMMIGVLPHIYRYLVYCCYCQFPKDSHFFRLKTYQHFQCRYWVVLLFLLYLGAALGLRVANSGYYEESSELEGLVYMLFADGFVLGIWYMLLAALLALMSSVDFKLHLIPLRLLLMLLFWVVIYHFILLGAWQKEDFGVGNMPVNPMITLSWWVDRGLWSIALWLIYRLVRYGIGMADIYFLWVLMFLFDGYSWLWVVCIACLLGVGYAFFSWLADIWRVVLLEILFRQKRAIERHFKQMQMQWVQHKTVPFGPWIALAAWLVLFAG